MSEAIVHYLPNAGEVTQSATEMISALEHIVMTSTDARDITWNYPELHKVADWLKVHGAAAELRARAVRIELIALRKIGMAGTADRLHIKVRKTAEWLVKVTDEEFNNILDTVSDKDTPIGMWNRSKKEEAELKQYLKYKHAANGNILNEHGEVSGYIPMDLNNAVRAILSTIMAEGKAFTISEAAETLVYRLKAEHKLDIPAELAIGPIRQVIRVALNRGTSKARVYIDQQDREVRSVEQVTFQDERGHFYHVPFEVAKIDQYEVMTEMRQGQMQNLAKHYWQQKAHLDALRKAQELYPSVDSIAQLHEIAVNLGFIVPTEQDAVEKSRANA